MADTNKIYIIILHFCILKQVHNQSFSRSFNKICCVKTFFPSLWTLVEHVLQITRVSSSSEL